MYRYGRLMRGYSPQIYSVGSRTRYRPYPTYTTTAVPGAGYQVNTLAWAHQPLLIGGRFSRGPGAKKGGSYGALGGLGATTPGNVLQFGAELLSNPDRALQRRSGAIIAATDRHLLRPLIDRAGRAMVPYMLKYVIPPFVLLTVLAGMGAYFSYQANDKLGRRRT